MTPEGKNVEYIKKRVHKAGGLVRKCSWENCRGAPDLLVMFPNVHAWIEVKAPNGQLEAHQEREIERMRKANCWVLVVYTIEDCEMAVDRILSASKYSGV